MGDPKMKYTNNHYISALSTLQEAFIKYEQALNQYKFAEETKSIQSRNVLSTERHSYQLEIMNAILEQKFFLFDNYFKFNPIYS